MRTTKRGLMVFLVSAMAVLALAGCGGGGGADQSANQTRSVPLNQVFTLPIDEQATLENESLTVTLRSVPDDSRCPEDVACVWEGNATVEVALKKTGSPSAVVRLSTSPRIGPNKASYQNYMIELVSLAPNRKSDRDIKPEDYVASLRAGKP